MSNLLAYLCRLLAWAPQNFAEFCWNLARASPVFFRFATRHSTAIMRIIHAASGRVGRGVFCAAAATGRLLHVGEVMGPPTSECLLLLSRVPVREDPPFSQRHFRVFLFGLLRPLRRRAAGAPSALCLSRCGAHRAPLHALCAAATAPVPARDYFPCPSAVHRHFRVSLRLYCSATSSALSVFGAICSPCICTSGALVLLPTGAAFMFSGDLRRHSWVYVTSGCLNILSDVWRYPLRHVWGGADALRLSDIRS